MDIKAGTTVRVAKIREDADPDWIGHHITGVEGKVAARTGVMVLVEFGDLSLYFWPDELEAVDETTGSSVRTAEMPQTLTMTYWAEKGMQNEARRVSDVIADNVGGTLYDIKFVHTDERENRLYTVDMMLGKAGWALFRASEEAFWHCAVDGVDWDGVLVDAPVFAAG